jgi:hypothetical protein
MKKNIFKTIGQRFFAVHRLPLAVAIIALAMAVACDDKDDTTSDDGQTTTPELSVSPSSYSAPAAASTYSIAVTSNTTWTASVTSANSDWVTISSGATGENNGAIALSFTANDAITSREATVTVSAAGLTRQVAITQDGVALTLSLNPADDIEATYEGTDPITITVTSNTDWTVAVTYAEGDAGNWVTTSDKTATSVKVAVGENETYAAREAAVVFTAGTKTESIAVKQGERPLGNVYSSATWTLGGLVWSDRIHVPDCQDGAWGTWDDPAETAKCKSDQPFLESDPTNEEVYYYYNWVYVMAHKETLCPSPWRVPSKADGDALFADEAVTRDWIWENWGTPGYTWGAEGYSGVGIDILIWTTDEDGPNSSTAPGIRATNQWGTTAPGVWDGNPKEAGGLVHCVHD